MKNIFPTPEAATAPHTMKLPLPCLKVEITMVVGVGVGLAPCLSCARISRLCMPNPNFLALIKDNWHG